MKLYKILVVSILSLMNSMSFAQEERNCDEIIDKKCVGQQCVNSNKIVNEIYRSCLGTNEDIIFFKENNGYIVDWKNLNIFSEWGYKSLFQQIYMDATTSKINFDILSYQFVGLKSKYEKFKQKNSLLKKTKEIDPNIENNKDLYEKIINYQKFETLSIESHINKLNFILKNKNYFANYKQAEKTIKPYFLDYKLSKDKFTDYKFKPYECEYIDFTFDKKVINILKKKYNYTCGED